MNKLEILQLKILWKRGIYPYYIRAKDGNLYELSTKVVYKKQKNITTKLIYRGFKNQTIILTKNTLGQIKEVIKFND